MYQKMKYIKPTEIWDMRLEFGAKKDENKSWARLVSHIVYYKRITNTVLLLFCRSLFKSNVCN